MIHNCKGSLTWIANDPVKKLWNGNGAVYKVKEKGNLFFLPSKEKERRTPDHRLIYTPRSKKKKKWNKSEKDMVSTALGFKFRFVAVKI